MKALLRLALLFFVLFSISTSYAQNQKGELKGKILDGVTKEALPYATVALYTAADTVMVTFRMSDEKGDFRVPGLPVNQKLRAIITMLGYQVYRKEFQLSPENPVLDLGIVGLEQASNELGEVVILAEIPPVLVRNDTLEFNAASFKTLPNSLVEDLLKKLPGVSVDQAGNIMVNGKSVQKILVDGKEFFGSDPQVATRNLPADVIEKVQVMNDPDALRRDPDMAESDIPQVINLTFKKGVKKGMFGKLYGGAGTHERYEGGGILNFFRDTTQVSVLGYSNNLNRPGFGMADMRKIGGFDRSGFNSVMIRSDGGYALNGVSFGGMGSGIQQSTGGGTNFNTVTKNGIKLNLQYFYGGVNDDLDQLINARQFLGNDTLDTRRTIDEGSTSHNHTVGGKIEWKLDSLTDISVEPSLKFSQRNASQNEYTSTYRNTNEFLNIGDNQEWQRDNNTSFSGRYSLNRTFKKKGRLFNIYGNFNYATVLQDRYNTVTNIFYEPEPFSTSLDQLRNDDTNSLGINNSVSYTEPLIKDVSAVIRLNSEYFKDNNTISTFARNPENGDYTFPIDDFSTQFDRKGWRNYVTTGIKWKIGDVTLQPSVRFTALNIESEFLEKPPVNQDYFYIFPSLNVRWKELNLSYNVDLREPNATDLQPIVDNTNPLFIRYGTPALKPTISHSVNLNFYKFDAQKSLNYSFFVYGSVSEDAITMKRTVEPTGIQITRPINTDGNWNLNGSGRISKDFKYTAGRQITLGASMWGGYRRSLILLNEISSYSQVLDLTPTLTAGLNLNDKFEFNQTFNVNFKRSRYENAAFTDQNIVRKASETGVVLRMPGKLVWEATFDYWSNSNVAPGLRNDYSRLNASVTFLFMKNDRAQLKLSVYDLLDQNINAYRVLRENLIEDFQTETLSRYGLLTFTYNIRNFGGKVGGKSNPIFWF